MRFKSISLLCECDGHLPARIREVGLTPQRQLVIKWHCAGCKQTHYTVKSLADYWRECPDEEEAVVAAKMTRSFLQDTDVQFLHSLGVRLPEGEEV